MDLRVRIAGSEFANPIWVASGTFGSGLEFAEFIDLEKVGGIVTKTVTLKAREGNRPPRIVETASGLLNSIGLENKGACFFKKEVYPELKRIKTGVIISIAGENEDDFLATAEMLTEKDFPAALELNLSCPNVIHGQTRYKLIAQDPDATARIVGAVKKRVSRPVVAKLTPNVTDIAEIAWAAQDSGADAVALVNTFLGMAVDADSMSPLLGNITGGLSGPAIKPLALRAVWEVYKKISIPIIGIGGIMTGKDAAEFILCGASAVQVGTANFVDPATPVKVLEELRDYIARHKIADIKVLTGRLRLPG